MIYYLLYNIHITHSLFIITNNIMYLIMYLLIFLIMFLLIYSSYLFVFIFTNIHLFVCLFIRVCHVNPFKLYVCTHVNLLIILINHY